MIQSKTTQTLAPQRILNDFRTSRLPTNATIQKIAFVTQVKPEDSVLLKFTAPSIVSAISTSGSPDGGSISGDELLVLSIPNGSREDSDLMSTAKAWVESEPGVSSSLNNVQTQMMTLQGAQIFFSNGRIAILAPSQRIDTIKAALIEVAYYEARLRLLESTLQQAWPQLEADMPMALDFDEKSVSKLKGLRKRALEVLMLRASQSKISAQVHAPHIHPPTLASQMAERFRERLQLVHRHEILDEQIDVFEKVYDSTAQRSSDFMLARTSHTLEWVIIVLLVAQLLLSGFEMLTSMGQVQ